MQVVVAQGCAVLVLMLLLLQSMYQNITCSRQQGDSSMSSKRPAAAADVCVSISGPWRWAYLHPALAEMQKHSSSSLAAAAAAGNPYKVQGKASAAAAGTSSSSTSSSSTSSHHLVPPVNAEVAASRAALQEYLASPGFEAQRARILKGSSQDQSLPARGILVNAGGIYMIPQLIGTLEVRCYSESTAAAHLQCVI